MAYIPAHVANSFLFQARLEGILDIDPLKIQKLVYFLHGWHLATRDAPAVGERFQAWPYGPVLASLYHEFKSNPASQEGHGANPIEGYAREIDPVSGKFRSLKISRDDIAFYDVFDRVWRRYKGMTGLSLSTLTHADGTPWKKSRDAGDMYLSDDDIKNYFRKLAIGQDSNE